MSYLVPISRQQFSMPLRRLRGSRSYMLRRLGQDQGAPPPPAIDPLTGQPISSTPPPAPSSAYGPAPTTVFNFGYNPPPSVAAGILGPTLSDIFLPPSESGESGSGLTIPGSTAGEIISNAATGALTPAQATTLASQEQQGLIQAGMNPTQAQQVAQADVNTALTANSAAPSQASFLGIPVKYLEWGAVGLGALIIFSLARKL